MAILTALLPSIIPFIFGKLKKSEAQAPKFITELGLLTLWQASEPLLVLYQETGSLEGGNVEVAISALAVVLARVANKVWDAHKNG
jgi:hypothetical protein